MFIRAEKKDSAFLRNLPRPDRAFHYKRVSSRQGVIKKTRKLNYDTMEITVACNEGDRVSPIFAKAGQYVTLFSDLIGAPRAFSLCRAPANDAPNEHTIMIRLVPGGKFSGWLFAEDRTGANLTVTGPMGRFGLDDDNRPIVCIAGGSGFSAIKALLEEAVVQQVPRNCLFLYGARAQRDLYYEEEMRAIKSGWHPGHRFDFVQVLSEEPFSSDWKGPRGLVGDYFRATYIERGVVDAANTSFFVCGPPPMVEAAELMLRDQHVPEGNIAYDRFSDANSPSPELDNTKCVLCEECLYVRPVEDCIVEIAAYTRTNGSKGGVSLIQPGQTAGLYYTTLFVNDEKCIRCNACVDVCPVGAFAPQAKPRRWSLSRLQS